jgi:hypothetical protein
MGMGEGGRERGAGNLYCTGTVEISTVLVSGGDEYSIDSLPLSPVTPLPPTRT